MSENPSKKPKKINWLNIIFFSVFISILYFEAGNFFKNEKQETVQIHLVAKDGRDIKFNIPRPYFIETGENKTIIGKKSRKGKNLKIYAILDEMKPLPIKTQTFSKNERHKQIEANNPNIISISVEKTSLNSEDIDGFNVLKKQIIENSEIEEFKYDLEIRKSFVGKNNNNKKDEISAESIMGLPQDTAYKSLLIECEEGVCMLLTNIPDLIFTTITFSESELSRWKEIYQKSHDLMKGFVVSE